MSDAALEDRGLWRGVIRPLAEWEPGPIVCDVRDLTIPEGLLAVTEAQVHAVGRGEFVDSLAQAYSGRLLLHASADEAWPAALDCRLAVLDAHCELVGHLHALARVGAEPAILLYGLTERPNDEDAPDPLALFGEGFEVVELDGFPEARLVVPVGAATSERFAAVARSASASANGDARNGRRTTPTAATEPRVADTAGAEAAALRIKLEHAKARISAAEAARHAAERRVGTSQDMIDALRVFNDEARADLGRLRQQVDDLRRQLRDLERLAEDARAESSVIGLERDGLRQERARLLRDLEADRALARVTRADLVRLEASHAWRLGHALARIARVLTFRRPGRTDALTKAIKRLDTAAPTRPDRNA